MLFNFSSDHNEEQDEANLRGMREAKGKLRKKSTIKKINVTHVKKRENRLA